MTDETLRVMWFVPPAVAVAASWMDHNEFRLDAVRTQSSDEQFDALVNSHTDAVITSMDNIFHWNQREGPKDFVVVAQIEATTPLHLIASRSVAKLRDLHGANILVDAPENGFVIALRAMLSDAGLLLDDYRLTPIGGVKERFEALLDGQGDATLLGAPFNTLALIRGLIEVASVQAVYPDFPGQVLIVRKPSIDRCPSLRTWISRLAAALSDLSKKDNLQKLKDSLIQQNLPIDAVESMLSSLPTTLIPSRKGMELLVGHRKKLNLVGADSSYEEIVNLSFLK
jgi:ABC-type nitrate/sulfonate/bicarbonate transport system substrate-binding protein